MKVSTDVQGMVGLALAEKATWDSALFKLARQVLRGHTLPAPGNPSTKIILVRSMP
jgi:hypothetical protein